MKDVSTLVEALPYIQRYKGKTFVVKLGGELVERADALASIAADVTLLDHMGVRIVVVHGGGPQADRLSTQLGLEPMHIEGRRVTDDAALEVTKMVFAGKINLEVVSALRARGLRVVGLSGVAGDIIRATRRPPRTMTDPATGETRQVDFGHVGDVRSVDTSLLRLLAANGYVPVVACLAGDGEGHVLNINADTVAAAIAVDLQAEKLVVLSNVPGLLRDPTDPTSLIRTLASEDARRMLAQGVVGGGMAPKLTAVLDAVEGGVPRAHLLDGVAANSLLIEVFSKQGTGTMVAKAEEVAHYRRLIGEADGPAK
jgi:acetylglutamate kinase